MKLTITITTLIIIGDYSDEPGDNGSVCYHSFLEDPKEAQQEIINAVNDVYKGSIQFNSIKEMEEYFSWVKLEIQEITLDTGLNTMATEIIE